MKSENFQLIKKDLESWAITSALFLAPLTVEQLIQYVSHHSLNGWGIALAGVLGSLLKLIQKYNQMSVYSNQ